MSDLTFATQSQPSTFSPQSKQKSNKVAMILVAIVVLALVGQMGYFFYSRYVSNSLNSPFSNLSNNATMNYETQETNPLTPKDAIENPLQVSQVGPAYWEKGRGWLDTISKFPDEYVIKSELRWTVQGKIVRVDLEPEDLNEEGFGAQLNLINTKGQTLGLRLSPTEVAKLKVLKVHQGVIEKEMTIQDVKPGDMVDVTVGVDLFDMRSNAENVLIEVRTY